MIGAATSMLPMVAGIAQEGMKLATELVKMASQMAKSQSGGKEGEGDQNKIAHEAMHNKDRIDFAKNDSANGNVTINIAS